MRPINLRVDEDITKAWIEQYENYYRNNEAIHWPIRLKLTKKEYDSFNLDADKIKITGNIKNIQEYFFVGVFGSNDMAVAYYMEDDVLYANYRIRFPNKEDDFFIRKVRINSPQDIPPSLYNEMKVLVEQLPYKAKFLKFNPLHSVFMNYRGGVL